jgi:hypothetical protein
LFLRRWKINGHEKLFLVRHSLTYDDRKSSDMAGCS